MDCVDRSIKQTINQSINQTLFVLNFAYDSPQSKKQKKDNSIEKGTQGLFQKSHKFAMRTHQRQEMTLKVQNEIKQKKNDIISEVCVCVCAELSKTITDRHSIKRKIQKNTKY